MMMGTLSAGGMEVLSDGFREADEDNPNGYYELEVVKSLKDDCTWLAGARGKAFKAVYRLLYDLPPHFHYKVILMKRNLKEVVLSQQVMLERQQRKGAELDGQRLIDAFQNEIDRVQSWMARQPNVEYLPIDFKEAVAKPTDVAREVAGFLGVQLDVDRMAKVVDPELYRQRADQRMDSGAVPGSV